MRKKTHEQLLEKVKLNYTDRGSYLRILSKYIDMHTKILCEDKYGEVEVFPSHLYEGRITTIKCAVNPTEYFKNKLKDKNPHYQNGDFWVKGDYVGTHTPILCENRFGLTEPAPNHLLDGGIPSIRSAVTPTQYLINQFIEVWGDRYGYEKVSFESMKINVQIWCRVHKEYFFQTPANHLRGSGCKRCATEFVNIPYKSNTEEFIQKANKVHNNRYNYNLTHYVNNHTKVEIICPTHGSFWQQPNNHLHGQGCYKCDLEQRKEKHYGWGWKGWQKQASVSKHFDSFKVYIIKCWNGTEIFYKIGKTFRTIKKRFGGKYEMPYQYEVLHIIESKTDAKYIYDLENELKRLHKSLKYAPNITFGGRFECFSKINMKIINKNLVV